MRDDYSEFRRSVEAFAAAASAIGSWSQASSAQASPAADCNGCDPHAVGSARDCAD
jgi:hypothetical protein